MALFSWNPIVITEFAGEGHNDALMILCVVLALLWIVRRRTVAGTLALGAGVLAKFLPAVFAPAVLVYLWRTREDNVRFWRTLGLCAVVCAAFGAALYAPFWAGHETVEGLRAAARARSGPGTSGALLWLFSAAFPPDRAGAATRLITTAVLLAFVTVASLRVRNRRTLVAACAAIALAYVLIAAPRFWPWYVGLPTALLALSPTRQNVSLVIVMTFCAKLVAPLDVIRVMGAVDWNTEVAAMTVVGVLVPLLVWATTHMAGITRRAS
jgi:alpha-1,6-mannosyltransferase